MQLTEELQKLRQAHADLGQVIEVFEAADKVCKEALIAMGHGVSLNAEPVASTSMAFTFTPDVSTSEEPSAWAYQ